MFDSYYVQVMCYFSASRTRARAPDGSVSQGVLVMTIFIVFLGGRHGLMARWLDVG